MTEQTLLARDYMLQITCSVNIQIQKQDKTVSNET